MINTSQLLSGRRGFRPHRTASITVVLASLFLLCACSTGTPATTNDAGEAPRFKNWWNFHERGMERMRTADWAGARADFETALGLRGGARFGNDRDEWRVRSYGMHFVEGYFPNRELGIALYELGDLDGAIRQLEQSQKQTPSARARYYLNQANRARLARTGTAAPSIRFSPETAGTRLTSARSLVVSGLAAGDGRIARAAVAGHPFWIELAEPTYPIERRVALKDGTNRIEVTAEDLLGQRSVGTIECVADWTPPRLGMANPGRDGTARTFELLADDDRGLRAFRVDGRNILAGLGGTFQRHAVRLEPGAALAVEVEDLAGNCVTARFDEVTMLRADAGLGYAIADAGKPDLRGAADSMQPLLRLDVPGERMTAYEEEFAAGVTVEDGGGVADVTVNGEGKMPPPLQGAAQVRLTLRLPLKEGTNRFVLVAHDRAGNEAQKTFEVVYRRPANEDTAFRMTVAVPPLAGANDDPDAVVAHRRVEKSLGARPARFHVLERGDGWERVLDEHKLSHSDLADPKIQLQIGRLMPAELLWLGSVRREGRGTTLCVKVVESGGGETLCMDDVYTEAADGIAEREVDGLVLKIRQHFPLVDAIVTDVSGDKVKLDAGSAAGIARGTRFVVLENPDELGGEVLRSGDRLVELAVSDVNRDRSRARILPAEAAPLLRKGSHVSTR